MLDSQIKSPGLSLLGCLKLLLYVFQVENLNDLRNRVFARRNLFRNGSGVYKKVRETMKIERLYPRWKKSFETFTVDCAIFNLYFRKKWPRNNPLNIWHKFTLHPV